jgi:hypothetical protein
VLWKLHFKKAPPFLFQFQPPFAIDLATRLHQTAKEKGWTAVEPREKPVLTDDDWAMRLPPESRAVVTAGRVVGLDDSVVLALQFGRDLVKCVRVRSGHTTYFSEEILEARDDKILRDIRTEAPPSGSAH